MIGRLKPAEFDALDLLYTMDAHVTPISRPDLAARLGIKDNAAGQRMVRLRRAGLVTIHRAEWHSPVSYEPSELGAEMYAEALAAMDAATDGSDAGVSIYSVARAALCVSLLSTDWAVA